MTNYDWLISRLDAFIRKYYANRVIRGSLIFLICLLFYILTVSVSEYYFYMPSWLRVSLVSLFVILGLSALVIWVVIPLTKMARLGKIISHEEAARIVGIHFPEISDKLLNILQLKKNADGQASRNLIQASIDQKAAQISVVPIAGAIDLGKNKRYLPYLLPLVLIGIFILVAAPNIFREASARLLQPTRSFEKPAPFQFVIQSQPLKAVRNADYILKVKVEGNVLPGEMSVELNGKDIVPMQAAAKNEFQYTFRNVTEVVNFRLFAAGYYSQPYRLAVVQKPVLKAFKVNIDYPDYTGRKDEMRNSLGDMTLPAGTLVSWAFMAEHTDVATFSLGDGPKVNLPRASSMFASQYRFMNDTSYTFTLSNKESAAKDDYEYIVKVIPDQFPVIQMQEFRDTVTGKQILMTGTAGDDYGISKVLFHFEVTDAQNKVLSHRNLPVKSTGGALTTFQQYLDIEALSLQPGQKVSYYIEAWDNDGVHGSKASRSEVMTFQMFDSQQLDSAINENAEQINSGLSNSSEQTKQLQNEYKDLQSKMLQSENMDFEQQQTLKQLMEKQEKLQNQMEAIKKRFEEQMQQSKQKEYSEDVKDKQEDLKKQMDNLVDEELKKQMEKLQELMKKLNKENAFQTMKQLEQENKLFNMDLERMQELMKQLEMQMRMEDMANKMDELAGKQEGLKEKTEQKKKDNESLSKEQEGLKKELDKAMKEEMKELKDLNKDMKQKEDVAGAEQKGENAEQQMQQSQESLQQNQNSKSGKSQQQAAQNLRDMAQQLRQMAGGMDMQQIEMDIKAVRQVLTNLMRLSFDQEQLMNRVQTTSASSATYLDNQQEQHRLHSNSKMIRDSLFILSKRLSKLHTKVNKETFELEKNMEASTTALEGRRISEAATRQQYVMTHTNELALMLNEILSNLMQMQSQSQQPGQGSCNKPGGKTPKPGAGKQLGDIITQQQQMGNMMQQMQNAQKKPGQQSGEGGEGGQPSNSEGQKPGEGKDGEYGNAEQLARMAAQQSAIRRQLQELNSLLSGQGLGNAKELKEIQEKMDKVETDLVNKKLSSEMLLRQREILTRLLEAEKALREQEQDDKRSSKTADDISRPIPPELRKYMHDRQQLLELYKTVPPQLKPYYKNMVEQYYQLIGNK